LEFKRKNMRKDDRVELKTETNILFGVCREKNSHKIPEKVMTKNISNGGLCVVSDVEVKKGTVLATEIVLNTAGMEKFKAYCEVIWSRKADEGGKFETGLQFIGLKPMEEKLLEDYLKTYIYN
jgi:c-di-GMP-binding flagellar brake protein YcgR